MKFIPLLFLIGTTPFIIQTSATAAQAASRQTTASPTASPTSQRPARIRVRRAVRIATPTPTPTPTPKPVRTRRAAPTPTPTPEKEAEEEKTESTGERGFFSRVFSIGGFHERQPEAETTPEATPEATPTPAEPVRNKAVHRSSTPPPPTPQEHEEVYAAQLPSIQTGGASYQSGLPPFQAAAAPSPVNPAAAPSTPPAPTATPPALSPEPVVAALPTPPPNPELDRERYLKVKKEAAAAPEIAALGEKVNATPPGEGQQKLAREYTKALFKKMESIDGSQQEWFQRLEAATLRRIDAGKPFVAE
ncbi:MAG TPA: hypothetical protein VNQ90_01745 [Chthoniobacteraceae bacterium]|nr:hypothetical protein [Chthoniobacteraceae bacterium]